MYKQGQIIVWDLSCIISKLSREMQREPGKLNNLNGQKSNLLYMLWTVKKLVSWFWRSLSQY